MEDIFKTHIPQQPHSMYLSTIPNKIKPIPAIHNQLLVDDIKGARSKFIEKPFKPRQTFNYTNEDIDKSHPKTLIPRTVSSNRPNDPLRLDDIIGTRTKMNKFTTTRQTNPLNPFYELAKVQYYPIEEPKFIRDSIQTHDIEGTKTKETFAMRLERMGKISSTKLHFLNTTNFCPPKRLYVKSTNENRQLDVRDINIKAQKQPRMTNPLQPTYTLASDEPKQPIQYGEIEKSKTKPTPKKASHPNFSLYTEDIQGAYPKKDNFLIPPKEEIQGTRAQTHKRGINSKRCTNPLVPSYDYPGCSSGIARPKTAHQRLDDFLK